MKLLSTNIKNGPQIIKTKVFKDKRGFLKETFKNTIFKNEKFPFDIMSFSKKNVLRGLHLQEKNTQSKIITVTYGKIFDVAVDLRKRSKTSILVVAESCLVFIIFSTSSVLPILNLLHL